MTENGKVPVVWLSDSGLASEKSRLLRTLTVLEALSKETLDKLQAIEIEEGFRKGEANDHLDETIKKEAPVSYINDIDSPPDMLIDPPKVTR